MKIVVDTNVVISGIFFGGAPRLVLQAIYEDRISAFASPEIVEEYREIFQEMFDKARRRPRTDALIQFIPKLSIIEPSSNIAICRDPDDNKFLNCACDSHCVYIVSGDKDLLVLKAVEGVEIITAKQFCERYLDLP